MNRARPGSRVFTAVCAVSALLVCGCGDVVVQHGDHPDAPLSAVSSQPAAETTPFAGLSSPPLASAVVGLDVVRVDGSGSVALAALLGQRATVLTFWEMSCAACVQELPGLEQIAPALERQGVHVIVVALDGAERTRDYFTGRHVNLPVFADGNAHDGLGLLGVPTAAVLAANGAVAYRLEGSTDDAGLAQRLTEMGISTH